MALLESLANVVEEAEVGFSRENANLTLEVSLPPSPSRAIRLRLYGGMAPRGIHSIDGPAYMYPRCQVLVRGEPGMATAPEQDAYALYYYMSKIKNRVINGTRIVAIDAVDYPMYLETDADNRRSYVFNLEVSEGRL